MKTTYPREVELRNLPKNVLRAAMSASNPHEGLPRVRELLGRVPRSIGVLLRDYWSWRRSVAARRVETRQARTTDPLDTPFAERLRSYRMRPFDWRENYDLMIRQKK